MALNSLIQSIVDEGSGVVIATLGSNFNDSRYVYPEALRLMLASGQFGAEWRPADTACAELVSLFEESGHRAKDIKWQGFARQKGKGGTDGVAGTQYLYVVKDHRLLLRSPD